jgi:glyceraldehyde-3-phosphate dehydrogenase (NAD(P))
MKVLVNGIGNIGGTLIHLLHKYKQLLHIDTVFSLKNAPMPWHEEELKDLQELGIIVCVRGNDHSYTCLEDVLSDVDYIFDCTSNGGGTTNKDWYDGLSSLKGASAQGSEKNFGTSFMTGVNDAIIKNEKYAHIVSCNTHSIACLLSTFTGKELDNLKEADFVIVRRSEDLGNHERLVSANVVSRHLDDTLGTHHSIDVLDLFQTIGISPKLSSSDITTPSQLMHGVRFNIRLKEPITAKEVEERIANNPLVSSSTKFDSNVIFERGRRIGFQGRIFSHSVIIDNNILIIDDRLVGWAFIPQEGNTLLSTVHAFLLQTNTANAPEIMQQLTNDLIKEKW